jgi:hypothetical protein
MVDDICDHDKIIEYNIQIKNIFEQIHNLTNDLSDVDSKVEVANSKIAQIKFDKAQEVADERSWLQRNTIGLFGTVIGALIGGIVFILYYAVTTH